MKINKNNYEKYFLDYHEGNLPAELVAELFLFLESHPELKAEFESFENISLSDAPVIAFPDKDLLKKGHLDESNYTRYFVAHVEGTLSRNEKLMLEEFLVKFPQYKKELSLFEKTKLHPDLAVVYDDKRSLKKPVPLFAERQTWYYVAAAACILLMLGVFIINRSTPGEIKYAQQDTVTNTGNKVVEKIENAPIANINEKDTATEKSSPAGEKKHIIKVKRGIPSNSLAQQSDKNKVRNKQVQAEMQPEQIAYMQPIEPVFATNEPEAELKNEKNKSKRIPYTLTASTEIKPYLTLKEMLAQYSTDKLREGINDKPLADELTNKKISRKGKSIKLAGWCLQKVTGKKVDVKTTYDQQGKLTAYHISAGRLKFGKTFASR